MSTPTMSMGATAPSAGDVPSTETQPADDVAALKSELAALKGRKEPDVAQLVEERLAAALAPIMERLGPAPEAPKVADPVAAQAIDDSRKELAKLRKEIAEEKRAAHEASVRANVAGKLAQHVRPEAADVALGYFLDACQAVKVVDERGKLRASWDGADYDSIDDAINAFLGSKQAAVFLPPPKATPPLQPKQAAALGVRQPQSIASSVQERLAALRAAGYDV